MSNTATFNDWNEFINNLKLNHVHNYVMNDVIINNDSGVDYMTLSELHDVGSIIITNLKLNQSIKSTKNYFKLINLKLLVIHNIQAQGLEDVSNMFEGMAADYVKLDFRLINVINADKMFANSRINKLDINLRFSDKLQSAVEMFSGCYNLTPKMISSIITYNAKTDNMFQNCCFENSLITKLTNNNNEAMLPKDEQLYDKLLKQFHKVNEHIDTSFNKIQSIVESLNNRVDGLESKLMTTNNNVENIQSIVESLNNSVEIIESRLMTTNNDIENIESKLTTVNSSIKTLDAHVVSLNKESQRSKNQINCLDSKVKGNEQAIKLSVDVQNSLTGLISRMDGLLNNMSSRLEALESKH